MAFGISGNPNTEIIMLANKLNQLVGVGKPVFGFLKFFLALRRISS